MLSIGEQDQLIRRSFPDFKLVLDCGLFAYWEGSLTPLSQTYRIRIRYMPKRLYRWFWMLGSHEVVTVLDPLVGPDPRGTGEPPQHVYKLGYPETHPRLCVHDPVENEWGPDRSIAEFLIPMVIKWLIFHEDWVDTGVWRGGGRHPEIPASEAASGAAPSPAERALRERTASAAFHRIGQRSGTYGSYLWMAAEYENYSTQRSLFKSNPVTRPSEVVRPLSTAAPEHSQAA